MTGDSPRPRTVRLTVVLKHTLVAESDEEKFWGDSNNFPSLFGRQAVRVTHRRAVPLPASLGAMLRLR